MDTYHRKIGSKIWLLSQFLILLLPSALYGQFHKLETKNLRLIYLSKAQEYLAPHVARCFENALRFHRALFDYTPAEEVTVIMEDFGDYGNGGATTVPYNLIRVGISPFSYVYETMPANERMNWMMNHELAHVVTMDQASGKDSFFRSLFWGKVSPTRDQPVSMIYSYLTNPRRYTPRWYLEGSAVFLETWMAGGLGRTLGAYDEMVFRTMVRDSSYIYDVVGLESEGTTIDFQVGVNSYLYGTRFMSYLACQYSPEKLINWLSRTNGSKAYFASQFKKTYGISLDDEWSRWIEWEHQWQKANLDSIRLYPTTPYRQISQNALGSVSRAFYDSTNKKIYVAVLYPGKTAHIASINLATGAIEKICEVQGPALYFVSALAFDQTSGNIFYTTDNNSWRDLCAVDIRTGKSRRLIKDVRVGDLAFNQADKSIWGVRHDNALSTLVRMPFPYTEWNQVYTFPYGKDIYDLDISLDGKHLTAALAEISGRQRLIKMDIDRLMNDDNTYEILFDFENSNPANFVFSSDGNFLYGSSYYSGVSNIYRYDYANKEMQIISNCETGFFRPVPVAKDSLIVFRYTGKGFVPVMIPNQPPKFVGAIKFLGNEIVEKYPIVKTWIVGSPASINIDSLITFSGGYDLLRNLKFASAYPIVEGYKDFAAIGARLDFSDRLGFSRFDLTASYSPNKVLPTEERIHLGFNFHHWQWKISATYNGADFYDLFGPTKTSRKGYSLALQYKKSLLYEAPKTMDLNIKASGHGGLERLPDFQNISAPFAKVLSFSTGLNYQYLRKSLGAVDEEKGVRWQLISHSNYVNAQIFSRIYTNVDYGVALPISHSSIWLRSSFGYSFGDRDEPFANFYFGGFGNNWVDHLTEKRYREYYSFPGVELNEIGGTNYGKTILEWTLPPIRFRRFGFPALYSNWARIALFSSGIVTNLESKGDRRILLDFGGQIDFKIIILSHLDTTFSLGYASAVEKDHRPAKEFMISLKVL